MTRNESTVGWDAIRARLREVYGEQEPRHFATLIKWSMGGPDPLDGVDCYAADSSWHYVTYGLSDLYGERPGQGGRSGFGHELTLRVARRDADTQPPIWPAAALQRISRRVFESGHAFSVGDWLDLERPIDDDPATRLQAILFAADPQLASIDTENGHVAFVQVVPVTADELEAARAWYCDAFVGLLRERDAQLVTDTHRQSYRLDPAFEAAIQAGIDRDGSSCGSATTERLNWERSADELSLEIGAVAVPELTRALRGRIPFGRPFRFIGPEGVVVFWPEGLADPGKPEEDDALKIDLSAEMAAAIRRTLSATRGRYRFSEVPGLTLVVAPTVVRDDDGAVVEVLG